MARATQTQEWGEFEILYRPPSPPPPHLFSLLLLLLNARLSWLCADYDCVCVCVCACALLSAALLFCVFSDFSFIPWHSLAAQSNERISSVLTRWRRMMTGPLVACCHAAPSHDADSSDSQGAMVHKCQLNCVCACVRVCVLEPDWYGIFFRSNANALTWE